MVNSMSLEICKCQGAADFLGVLGEYLEDGNAEAKIRLTQHSKAIVKTKEREIGPNRGLSSPVGRG